MGRKTNVLDALNELGAYYSPAARSAMSPQLAALWDRFDRAVPQITAAVEALDNVTASLETMQAHFGDRTPEQDFRSREDRIAEAQYALRAIRSYGPLSTNEGGR